MRRKYSLVCQSTKQKQNLHIALTLAGFNEVLKQEYNYIISEFCNLRPIPIEKKLLLDTNTIKEMYNSIMFFIDTGIPDSKKIYYTNHYIDKTQPLSQRIISQLNNQNNQNEKIENTLDSPTREYTDEDYEEARECIDWFEIGIKHVAYLQISDN
jgi:hypothetical protein